MEATRKPPTRVLFSCVAENQPTWFRKVHNLALSLRSFGGSLARSPMVANFVGGVDASYRRTLGELDVDVTVVQPFHANNPYANKLRMLELGDMDRFDVLVALDCDTIVVDDITPFLPDGAVAAKTADADFLSSEEWRRIFSAFSLPEPERTYTTTSFGQETYPYFNSGVLLVPSALCGPLLSLWGRFVVDLETVYETHRDIAARRTYNDQIALTCAVAAGDLSVRPLPVSMNFPTHINVHRRFLSERSHIRVVHYHSEIVDSGFLRASKYREVNRYLDRFNRRRAEALNLPYSRLPSRAIRSRIRHELASTRWYHDLRVERLRGRVKNVLASLRSKEGMNP
jgi:hypothetical protein